MAPAPHVSFARPGLEAWVRFLGPGATRFALEVRESLRHVGVRAVPHGPGTPPGPGIVFFDTDLSGALEAVRRPWPGVAGRVLVVATSERALVDGACWRLLEAGAADVLVWTRAGGGAAAQLAARLERWEAVDRLIASPGVRERLVGQSPAWLGVLRQVAEVAALTDAPVLLMGESGTGKEELARLIHALDSRADKGELVTLDCTVVVPELAGSEFFGHERGAFTGATGAREGAFARADGGTLFLDEVGELPLALQAQLLRVVQERTYKLVGSNTWRRTRFRLVCATHRELASEVPQGRFRKDLYHRLAAQVFHLPPLRERPEDILPLARHFLRALRPEAPPELDAAVATYLQGREYPGNVRELRQLMGRLFRRHVGHGPITVGDIPADERPAAQEPERWRDAAFARAVRRALDCGVGLKELSRLTAETAVDLALADEGGNLQRAARRLGVTDRALQLRRARWKA